MPMDLDDFSLGVFIGLLIGEGHFGGDGRQPQVTLRMHTRHEKLLRWVAAMFPGGRLYGPYSHGGRNYMQWMARGPYLRDVILPVVGPCIRPLDSHVWSRIRDMCTRYHLKAGPET
jgi:hypothetical protein